MFSQDGQNIRRGEIPAVFALRGLYSVILEAGHILIWQALKLLEAAGFVYHISRELDPAHWAGSSPQSDPVPQSGPVMEGDRHES